MGEVPKNEEEFNSMFSSANIEMDFNSNNLTTLPMGLMCPASGGKVYWLCSESTDVRECFAVGSFVSEMLGDKGKDVRTYKNMQEVEYTRDELLKHGWKPMDPPSIKIKDPNGVERPMNRKEKRFFEKKKEQYIKKMSKMEGQ